MKKVLLLTIFAAICLLTISSCSKDTSCIALAIAIYITDKNGNDILDEDNPNCIAEKISVTYKGETFNNMHPTDNGSLMPFYDEIGAYISSDRKPNELFISTGYSTGNQAENLIPWEEGEEIVITMPNGTKHVITYVGSWDRRRMSQRWLFDDTEEFKEEYTIVYDPSSQNSQE